MSAERTRRLRRVLEREMSRPYTYGVSDCFLLGCHVADELAGRNMVGTYRVSYRTLRGAHRALLKAGYHSLTEFFEDRFVRISPSLARVGDLAVVRLSGGADHVAFHDGRWFRTRVESGLLRCEMSDCVSAFRNK